MGRTEVLLQRRTKKKSEAKPPVNEEEKTQKRIQVVRETITLTWLF